MLKTEVQWRKDLFLICPLLFQNWIQVLEKVTPLEEPTVDEPGVELQVPHFGVISCGFCRGYVLVPHWTCNLALPELEPTLQRLNKELGKYWMIQHCFPQVGSYFRLTGWRVGLICGCKSHTRAQGFPLAFVLQQSCYSTVSRKMSSTSGIYSTLKCAF